MTVMSSFGSRDGNYDANLAADQRSTGHQSVCQNPPVPFSSYWTLVPDMPEKPELVARLWVGSAISGECSVCHEVIVVRGAVTAELGELNATLKQVFEKHIGSKHSLEGSEHGITIGRTPPLAGVALVSCAALLME